MGVREGARERIADLNNWRGAIGLGSLLRWLLIRLRRKLRLGEPKTLRLRPRQARLPLTARLRDSSDLSVFRQIFVDEEYACLRDLPDVSLILDLGANAGYSSAYFLNCFPRARVVAVEPDDRNVAISARNLAPYGDRARLLHGAAWSHNTRLRVVKGSYRDGKEWTTQVAKPAGEAAADIPAWDVETLIEKSGGGCVDLLKVDIERAELEVFGNGARAWLPRVHNICIELHGPDCQAAFFGALADYDYELERSGELVICRNLRVRLAK